MITSIDTLTETIYDRYLTIDGKSYRFEIIQHRDAVRDDAGASHYSTPRFEVYRDEMKLLPSMVPEAIEEIVAIVLDRGGYKLSESANV